MREIQSNQCYEGRERTADIPHGPKRLRTATGPRNKKQRPPWADKTKTDRGINCFQPWERKRKQKGDQSA